ncbi:sensor histidine kinase KdpD [Paenibacillus xylanexedens]|uniref:sensor histidine kinase n=1 Tax=Paenibacillus xylanexedens TaxID=528191 RepID=UPI0011A88B16|nr:HAMP domain-containing sensor histidine kinase [Paenibacillus xylanexedens]
MKVKLRYGIHFILGFLAWLLSMAFMTILTTEIILPVLGITADNTNYDLFVTLTFVVNIMMCSIVFSWYFGGPLWFIMSWIDNLTKGKYEAPVTRKNKVYTKKHKLRRPYRLYKEVIDNIHILADSLQEAELERKNMEESKRDWIAGISHDLKTPLTYITGYTALLMNDEYIWSVEEQQSFLLEVHNKSLHLERLIQDLNLSLQIENATFQIPIHLKSGNLISFIENLITDIRNNPNSAEYKISFHTEEKTIMTSYDERLLYRALQNLLMNAVIHNPAGTEIKLTLAFKNDSSIELIIFDNGVGMRPETLKNIFTKYYRGSTTHAPEFGTGLGMAIAKQLIIAHNGLISMDSELSKGTIVYITLPYIKEISAD